MATRRYQVNINPDVDVVGPTPSPPLAHLQYTDAAIMLGDSVETLGPYVSVYLKVSSSLRLTGEASGSPGIRIVVGFTDNTDEELVKKEGHGGSWRHLNNDLDTLASAWFVAEGVGNSFELDDVGSDAALRAHNPSTSTSVTLRERYQISAANRSKTIDWVDIYHDLGDGPPTEKSIHLQTLSPAIAMPNAAPSTDGDTGVLTITGIGYLYDPTANPDAVGLYMRLNNSGTSTQRVSAGGVNVFADYTTGEPQTLVDGDFRSLSVTRGQRWYEFQKVNNSPDVLLQAEGTPTAATTLITSEKFALQSARVFNGIRFELR